MSTGRKPPLLVNDPKPRKEVSADQQSAGSEAAKNCFPAGSVQSPHQGRRTSSTYLRVHLRRRRPLKQEPEFRKPEGTTSEASDNTSPTAGGNAALPETTGRCITLYTKSGSLKRGTVKQRTQTPPAPKPKPRRRQ
ncbi:hypothetical protein V1264_020045 [Littorina saxatilis]|uniref:Uncharacterized protein n=1 Tax=Littorina saxatilis TaxID=31220 RepID=A0AAN9B9C0_9CAEN